MKKIILLVMLPLIIITGCIRVWDDVVTECQRKNYTDECGYTKCLQENSASFGDGIQIQTNYIYQNCQLINCQAKLISK